MPKFEDLNMQESELADKALLKVDGLKKKKEQFILNEDVDNTSTFNESVKKMWLF